MDTNSNRKLQSDWYSPTRLHNSPVEYDFPGDRFIPNRSLMDLDQAHTLLTTPNQKSSKPKFKAEYRRKLENNLKLDVEGRPFQMLVFRGSPKSSRKSNRLIDEMRRSDEEILNHKSRRQFPKVRCLTGHQNRVGSVAWNGQILTSGSSDNAIINHDVRARNSLACCMEVHTNEVCGLKWSNTGNRLASGGNDNLVYIWDARKMGAMQYIYRFSDHCAAVKALAWCPYNYDVLASGGGTDDGAIKIWNIQKGTCINSIDTKAQISGLQWNKHHQEILSGHGFGYGCQNQLCLWRYPSMCKIGGSMNHTSRVLHLSQSPDGLTVVSAGADETLRFWEVFGPSRDANSRISHLDSLLSLKTSPIR
ncbi:cell division cycle 20.2, cofactor of APC complex-like isoform X2 [Olea europaea var. sylvestris]|uniref:cell division cycle 20.2, cofactor of APC complex-like isoform X2 n=1 Tax=Olea europaea var. sylvestris TaxID=158386 RepID=UPI000C1D88CB|nr:cell division cycle 20.2, cofactor of APC complex-like isoform X2 [Olea europaea var. sylvestris]